MAYNPYNPYMNNGYYPQYNNYQQYQAQTPQPQMQRQPVSQPSFETPIQDIRFVTSEEAKAYIVYPNSKALLIDRQNKIAHLKTADNMGQSSSKTYKFEEVDGNGNALAKDCPNPAFDIKEYAKKEELNSLKEKLSLLDSKINKVLNVRDIIDGETSKKQQNKNVQEERK